MAEFCTLKLFLLILSAPSALPPSSSGRPPSSIARPPVMASQGKKRLSITSSRKGNGNGGLISRFSRTVSESTILNQTKQAALDTAHVTHKLLQSTGKAAWIAGTTFLILLVPLIIAMDREQQFNELDMQQATLLGTPSVSTQK